MRRITEYLLADHERLSALLAAATSRSAVDRDAFAAFRAGLLRHIAIEEYDVFPAASKHLSDEQWRSIERMDSAP